MVRTRSGAGRDVPGQQRQRSTQSNTNRGRPGVMTVLKALLPALMRYGGKMAKRQFVKEAVKKKPKAKRARTYQKSVNALGVKMKQKGMPAKIADAARLGCIRRVESGGTVTDPDCVYVGHHDCPGQEMFDMFCRSVVRALCRKAGLDVDSWESGIPFASTTDNTALRLLVVYQPVGSSNTLTQAPPFDIGGGITLNSLASGLVGILRTIQTANPECRLSRISLQTLDPNRDIAHLQIGSSYVHVKTTSKLMVQNRTQSANPTTDVTGNLVNDVTNNPLVGYLYHCKGSGFRPRLLFNNQDADATIGQGFLSNNATGLITARAATTNPNQSKKPLFGSAFQGKVYMNKVQVLPGEIAKDRLIFYKKYRMNDFWRKINDDIVPAGDDNRNYRYIGESGMFGLEKALNARTEPAEPGITVGWELNQTYSMYVTGYARNIIMPLVSIRSRTDVDQQPL